MGTRGRAAAKSAVVLTVVAAAGLVWASPAHAAAGSLDVSGSMIYYIATPGTINHLVIQRSTTGPDDYTFIEVGSLTITSADPACWYSVPGATYAMTCTAPGLTRIVVDVRDGADAVINYTHQPTLVYGGGGDDALGLAWRVGTRSQGYGQAATHKMISGPVNDSIV